MAADRKKTQAQAQTRKTKPRNLARAAPAVAAASNAPDGLLLAGGFALVLLVLGDTIFLALSVRFLRRA